MIERPRAEDQYLNWAEAIRAYGEPSDDRTRVGTLDLFGEPEMRVDLREEFPLLTSKFVPTRLIKSELTWMLHGDTNLRYLTERNNHIWDEWPFVAYLRRTGQDIPEQDSDEWNQMIGEYLEKVLDDEDFAAEHGELGPVYGHQWRSWEGNDGKLIDQLRNNQEAIRTHNRELGRRLIVSAWNVGELEQMGLAGLPPCHTLYQFNTSNQVDPETGKPYLDLQLYQRSADWFLGVPFNMAQYAMLLSAMAQTTDHTPRYFYHKFGSAHIYQNHLKQVELQLSRRNDLYDAPTLQINPDVKDIGDFEPEDFVITGYRHHPSIKAPVAI